jgi:hypothetical protein
MRKQRGGDGTPGTCTTGPPAHGPRPTAPNFRRLPGAESTTGRRAAATGSVSGRTYENPGVNPPLDPDEVGLLYPESEADADVAELVQLTAESARLGGGQ